MLEQERHGRQAEISVLGGMLLEGPEAVDRTAQLKPADFFEPGDQLLFHALWEVRSREETVDAVAVHEELVANGHSGRVGGMDYLGKLMEAAVTAADIESHVRIVRAASEDRRRQRQFDALRKDLEKGIHDFDRTPDPLAVVSSLEASIETFRGAYGGRTGATVMSLAELLTDPEAGKPPAPVVDRLAWRGRVTLLAAREKMGKSTLASAAAAAVSHGHCFLRSNVAQSSVLYLSLEEHPHDVAGRLVAFKADPEAVYLLDRTSSPFQDLEAAIEVAEPELVILDTLAAFTESMELDPGSSTDWTPIMTRLARIARDHNVALLVLHHARKSDGRYRDSTAIGAGVDMILEMDEERDLPHVRKLKPRGRWKLEPYAVQYVEAIDAIPPHFRLAEGEVSLDTKVLLFVEDNPGCSQRNVEDGVSGNRSAIRETVRRLIGTALEDRGDSAKGRRLYPRSGSPENPHGRGPGAPQAHSRRAPGATVRPEGGSPPKGGAPRARLPDAARGAESGQQGLRGP